MNTCKKCIYSKPCRIERFILCGINFDEIKQDNKTCEDFETK